MFLWVLSLFGKYGCSSGSGGVWRNFGEMLMCVFSGNAGRRKEMNRGVMEVFVIVASWVGIGVH